MKTSLAIFLVIFTFHLSAQVNSKLGRFAVPVARGCTPFTVNIIAQDTLGDVSRDYTYEPGADPTLDTTYTYTVAGTYDIVQLVGATVTPKFDTLRVEVFDPAPPRFDYSFCNASEVFLTIADTLYDAYEIRTANDHLVLRRDADLSASLRFNPQESREVTVEGFYDDALANCGFSAEMVSTRDLINDIVITGSDLTFVCEKELNLEIGLIANPNTFYQIELREEGSAYRSVFEGFLTDSLFRESGIVIAESTRELCFRINALSQCDGRRIEGMDFCETFTAPNTIFEHAYASFVEAGIQLNFNQNPFGTYTAIKLTDGEPTTEFRDLDAGFVDQSVFPLRTYAYEVTFMPSCGSESHSVTLSPPFLKAEKSSENRYMLDWLSPTGIFDPALDYELFVSDFDSVQVSAIQSPTRPHSINLTSALGTSQIVWLQATTSEGITMRSVRLNLAYEFIVYVPRAFTPNNDGVNDRLEIFGLPTDQFTFKVINQWGQEIFETRDISSFWDGRQKNGAIREGTYLYTIEFLNEEGELFYQQGSFVLLKSR